MMSSIYLDFCFFFSSRRRHTRLQGDWSSDVCSSDLRRSERRCQFGPEFRITFPNCLPLPVPSDIILLRQTTSGGCFQWVLDAACQAVEWLSQPFCIPSLQVCPILGHH